MSAKFRCVRLPDIQLKVAKKAGVVTKTESWGSSKVIPSQSVEDRGGRRYLPRFSGPACGGIPMRIYASNVHWKHSTYYISA